MGILYEEPHTLTDPATPKITFPNLTISHSTGEIRL
jgi:hypothetical protein